MTTRLALLLGVVLLCACFLSASANRNCSAGSNEFLSLRVSKVLHEHQESFMKTGYNNSKRGCDAQGLALSWEKAWRARDKRLQLFSAEVVATSTSTPRPTTRRKNRRIKRRVYGLDDRVCIDPRRQSRDYPFSTVVKVSTGCTGTLVTHNHVLTAAHCIHNGSDYLPGYNTLKVGFLRPKGTFRWYPVSHTFLPFGWRLQRQIGPRYDYAVLTLKRKQRRQPMPIGVSHIDERADPNPTVYFSAYPDDKPSNSLCYRSCRVKVYDNDLLYFHCDAQPGSSGAGIYSFQWNEATQTYERRVVGVFSGNRWRFDGQEFGATNYNVAIRLPTLKYRQVCTWIGGFQCNPNETGNKSD